MTSPGFKRESFIGGLHGIVGTGSLRHHVRVVAEHPPINATRPREALKRANGARLLPVADQCAVIQARASR
jgi:hypothetical protein